MTRKSTFDVLILGAGAAGLACARELKDLDLLVIEARDRVGGRARTHAETAAEEGPEFIHGAQKVTFDLLSEHGMDFEDATDNHHFLKNGKLTTRHNFFEELGRLMPKHAPEGRDQSVAQWLAARRKLPADQRAIFQSFIEGFHAANLDAMSVRGLIDAEETDDPELEGVANFRPRLGYGPLLNAMARELIASGKLLLNTQARRIEWRSGHVNVEATDGSGKTRMFSARKLVCTLPLGVLKNSGDLTWSPAPKELSRRWEHLEVGHVQKIVFRMRERFWEKLGADRPVSFVHLGPEFDFPTWWTQHPRRSPLLVAWQGGPRAEAMSPWPANRVTDAAMTTLAKWSGFSTTKLQNEVVSVHRHDWSRDPFARGAYSYVGVGGQAGAKTFVKPLAKTIFFAGEATHTGSARGTVHGAFESGQRAAKLIRN